MKYVMENVDGKRLLVVAADDDERPAVEGIERCIEWHEGQAQIAEEIGNRVLMTWHRLAADKFRGWSHERTNGEKP